MLPFLQPRKITSMLIANRKPEGSIEVEPAKEMDHGLLSAAEDLIKAIHAKDAQGVASAMKACTQLCDNDDAVEENREGMI